MSNNGKNQSGFGSDQVMTADFIQMCNGCQVNWNGGNNPNSTGQILNSTGFNQAEVILDTQDTYLGPLFGNGNFNIALAPPPAKRPASATLFAVKTTSAGDTLRKLLITSTMDVVG
jgi:hypothetical protein